MKVSIWDIKASREDGMVVNFDIIVPINITNEKVVSTYANDYLKKSFSNYFIMISNRCSFCQIESRSPKVVGQIHNTGYYIDGIETYNT
ncbi:DUF2024 family protein [uncultured Aquimarina sp.]|uniref:DUF2024 family protein n=1 Tax=uncultured Aquimarina sp. TaxID=575652 RepID=UPI00261A41C1|nr:DUF2024 family protein [uncultured Aquimarina sp.]